MLEAIKGIGRRILRPPLHKPEVKPKYKFLGTQYGGWPLIEADFTKGALIYSFGVGEDLSFDLAAIERYSCRVEAFDPTPKSLDWVVRQSLPRQLTFHPIGIAAHDGETVFFPPANDGDTSFSATAAGNQDKSKRITAVVNRLSTIVERLGGVPPDILKMDIEGFEYEVLPDVMASGFRPGQLLIEFHHRMYENTEEQTFDAVELLKAEGYALFYVSSSGHEYGFVHESYLKLMLG